MHESRGGDHSFVQPNVPWGMRLPMNSPWGSLHAPAGFNLACFYGMGYPNASDMAIHHLRATEAETQDQTSKLSRSQSRRLRKQKSANAVSAAKQAASMGRGLGGPIILEDDDAFRDEEPMEASGVFERQTFTKERCETILAALESKDEEQNKRELASEVLADLTNDTQEGPRSRSFVEVAVSDKGCRMVQKVMELVPVAGLELLVQAMVPHTMELLHSPNGNHVLAKMIERLTGDALKPLIAELRNKEFTVVARHRFGCRVLQRLIEHCTVKEVVAELVHSIVADSYALCRHPYGNFVVQHIIEHGSADARGKIILNMVQGVQTLGFHIHADAAHGVPMLSKHRTASHVVQKALEFGDALHEKMIVEMLLYAPLGDHDLVEVSRSRYGSYVVEQIASRDMDGLEEVVKQSLASRLVDLVTTSYGQRVAIAWELIDIGETYVDASVL